MLADRVLTQVFRTDFTQPGFALVSLGRTVESAPLRRIMVSLKERMSDRYREIAGKSLIYLSMGRFDQQTTTRFHRDGAPEESFLMLGYEPSEVRSQLSMADYSRAAFDLGIDPRRFLDEYNPMYAPGETRLAPYITDVTAFDPFHSQIVIINNSACGYSQGETNSLGVLHRAVIANPVLEKSRVVNSTMLGIANEATDESILSPTRRMFIETNEIAKK